MSAWHKDKKEATARKRAGKDTRNDPAQPRRDPKRRTGGGMFEEQVKNIQNDLIPAAEESKREEIERD